MKRTVWLVLASFLSGCGAAAQTAPPSAAQAASPQRTSPATTVTTAASSDVSSAFPEAAAALESERVTGTMALFDTRDGKLRCSDSARCERGYTPASTFEIANSVIALENGVVDDAESPLPWDGKESTNPAWNRDHTLRSAIQVSCLPCFQGIARKIGPERLAQWVTRLDYGNHDISGQLDRFWLNGALRISAFQQIDFLRRLDGGKLPIAEHTLDVVRDILTLDVTSNYIFRGKTGSAAPPEEPMAAAWFIGWVELAERRVFFATVIDGHPAEVDVLPVRRRVTESVLRALGDLPS